MRNDLRIEDNEFHKEMDNIFLMCTESEKMLAFMILHLQKSTENMSGNTVANLRVLVEEIKELQGDFNYCGEESKTCINKFINDVEAADSWLYKGGK